MTMSGDGMESTQPPLDLPAEAEDESGPTDRIIIRSYPDVVFLYPTWLAAVVAGLAVEWSGITVMEPGNAGLLFTVAFFLNLSILIFDYTRVASLFFVVVLSAVAALSHMHPELGRVIEWLVDQPIFMNASFYWSWAALFSVVMLIVLLRSRMDYWVVEDGELLHRRMPFRVLERWPVEGMEVNREVNDVLEYLLFRSGRLILRPARSDRVIVIVNVPGIVEVDRRLHHLLGTSPEST